MENQTSCQEILNKILNSQEFIDSRTYQKLLKYLVDNSLKGLSPKEPSIAVDIFDRDISFNPSEDTIVRVAVHQLRKKLSYYYRTEGRNDKLRLTIPKGHYRVTFENNRLWMKFSLKHFLWVSNLLTIVLLVLVSSGILQKTNPHSEIRFSKDDPIWGDILNSPKPVLIVLGNLFFYEETSAGSNRIRYIRDPLINSTAEFDSLLSESSLTGRDLKILDRFYFLAEYGAYSLADLLPVFYESGKPFEIRLLAHLTTQDLSKYHILFIGYYKTMGLFDEFFKSSHFSYAIEPDKVFYRSTENDTLETFEPHGKPSEYHGDYSLLIKVTGPNDNKMIFCTGARLAGVIKTVKNITSVKSTRQIQNALADKYQEVPHHFEILYHVVGLGRSDLDSEIIRIEKLDPKLHLLGTSESLTLPE